MIKVLISGGQTGADQGGLRAASALGIPTGGYAPKGFKTEAGPAPYLGTEYCLMESDSPDYVDRTRDNVRLADATVTFGVRSVGSNKTEEFCRIAKKPCIWVWYGPGHPGITELEIMKFKLWLLRSKVDVLNCAGNRESKNIGIGKFTEAFLLEALK